MSTARLIPFLKASGELQMAIDTWLLEQHNPEVDRFCLRFYQWEPIALSLGYHQRHYPDHWRSFPWQEERIDVVRRPTGGRAVLHHGDLSYALVVAPPREHREATYRRLCQFLELGWKRLGFPLHYGSVRHSNREISNCFALTTPADLCLENGYKWIGSAQRWRSCPALNPSGSNTLGSNTLGSNALGSSISGSSISGSKTIVLQHGSIRLEPDRDLWNRIFGQDPSEPDSPLSNLAISNLAISNLTRGNLTIGNLTNLEAIVSELVHAAETCFQVRLIPQPLTPEEWIQIESYRQTVTLWNP